MESNYLTALSNHFDREGPWGSVIDYAHPIDSGDCGEKMLQYELFLRYHDLGLDYAHSQGVIHRDIKTANLFVTTDRIVKIMDFGLAKVLQEVRGATTLVSGTPFYMSPEQVLGDDVDHRSDLYSLGVTLFELATGRVPFDSGEVGYHHRHSPVPDPQSIRPDLPEDLCKLILRLLEKDPAARIQTASGVLEALFKINPD